MLGHEYGGAEGPSSPQDRRPTREREPEGRGGKVNELALFAGVGGGILGSVLLGWRTVAAVEINPYCREVLCRRQRDGMLPLFPIWDDIKTFRASQLGSAVDIITAGFPCQPFSIAGK